MPDPFATFRELTGSKPSVLSVPARPQASRPVRAAQNPFPTPNISMEVGGPFMGVQPQQPQAKPQPAAPRGYTPKTFRDPAYDVWEAEAAAKAGIPVAVLRGIRVDGERSNPDQVSSAGARSAYQFIPSTRAGIKQKYGVDAYASEKDAAFAAAYLLKENIDRAGSIEGGVRAYHGGWDPAGHGPVNQSYVQRVLGGLGEAASGGGFSNPFDPSYYNQALGQIDQAQQAALTPFSTEVARAPTPEMPDAPELAQRDFSETDKIIAQMAPEAFDDQEKSALRRRSLWQGAAQALGSLGENSGVGTILARVGAGMLGGRMYADEEIQQRSDDYDKKMDEYRQLQLRNEDNKASTKLAEANKEAEVVYNHSMQKWATKMDQWNKDNTVSMDGGALVVQSATPNGVRVTRLPIAALVTPQFSMARAETLGQLGNASNSAAMQVQGMVNGAIVEASMADADFEMKNAAVDPGVAEATATATYASTIVNSGLGETVFGSDFMQAGSSVVAERMGLTISSNGKPIFKDQAEQERFNQQLAGELTASLMSNPERRQQMQQHVPTLLGITNAAVK